MSSGQQPPQVELATVGAVYSDGITIIFDGDSSAGNKRYKCIKGATYQAGDRVKISRIGGTVIVEFPIGNPTT